jgi:16S rRNA (uracil1498-N3)-methyltransferase
MADRYFVSSPIDGPRARLVGSEAHHLAHVMRGRPGDTVILFDGSGAEFSARIESLGRADIELSVGPREAIDRELPLALTLGVALPKGDRQRWLVEKATELGVTRLVPLVTERAGDRATGTTLARLRRSVIEASKQCGRNRLMEIAPSQALDEFLTTAPSGAMRLIAQPGAQHCGGVIDELTAAGRPTSVILAIGPEGGFTSTELDAATATGWQAIGFGTRILRIETAALALVAAIASQLGPQGSRQQAN